MVIEIKNSKTKYPDRLVKPGDTFVIEGESGLQMPLVIYRNNEEELKLLDLTTFNRYNNSNFETYSVSKVAESLRESLRKCYNISSDINFFGYTNLKKITIEMD